MINERFWHGKKVLVTGHTGFIGSWLTHVLHGFGADVTGLALPINYSPNLYSLLRGRWSNFNEHLIDIRDAVRLTSKLQTAEFHIVFHLAAQPLVLKSYQEPLETLGTNVMGTANLLQALRNNKAQVHVVCTSDKCYSNENTGLAFNEKSPLGGKDPYSASKAACEIVTWSFFESYFKALGKAVLTVRAGNVIGGGDWSENRLIPDLMRAVENKTTLVLRNPNSTRPWQHVLEPVGAFLMLAEKAWSSPAGLSEPWNVGPQASGSLTVQEVLSIMEKLWPERVRFKATGEAGAPHEAPTLQISAEKIRERLGWSSVWDTQTAAAHTLDWYRLFLESKESGQHVAEMVDKTEQQIQHYFKEFTKKGLT